MIEVLCDEHGVQVCSEHVGIHDEPGVIYNQHDLTILVRVQTVCRLTLLVLRNCENKKPMIINFNHTLLEDSKVGFWMVQSPQRFYISANLFTS